ncbi:hypothetical protein BC940DRAFT_336755 [Gongronella butleri]|nr:hypothetical protein BC940DRAFT_336755 [Gongronella butleri]
MTLQRPRVAAPLVVFGLRHASSTTAGSSRKIYALPFKLKEERAPEVAYLTTYVTTHKFLGFFKLLKALVSRSLPKVNDTSNVQVRKVYLPMWYYDTAIRVTVHEEKSNEAVDLLTVSFDSYWPGHTLDPMCFLSFGHPLPIDKDDLRVFDPDAFQEDNDDVQVIPFTTNPIHDLADRVRDALPGLTVGKGKQACTVQEAEVVFGASYPLYMPCYIANVNDDDSVVVIAAHQENPTVYKYEVPTSSSSSDDDDDDSAAATKAARNTKQWLNGGQWLRLDVTDPALRVGFPQSPVQEAIGHFMDKVVNSPQSPLLHASTSSIDWDDLRIQSFKTHDKESKDYLQRLFSVWAKQRMLSALDHAKPGARALGVGKNGFEMKTPEQIKDDILGNLGDELEKLEQAEPAWLKEYNRSLMASRSPPTEDNVDVEKP